MKELHILLFWYLGIHWLLAEQQLKEYSPCSHWSCVGHVTVYTTSWQSFLQSSWSCWAPGRSPTYLYRFHPRHRHKVIIDNKAQKGMEDDYGADALLLSLLPLIFSLLCIILPSALRAESNKNTKPFLYIPLLFVQFFSPTLASLATPSLSSFTYLTEKPGIISKLNMDER